MHQHPIPQNISTYQFRLIGDMTLKQFLELLLGVGVAIFFWYTNLFTPIKLVLVVLPVVGGFALAFLPIQERPLDQWTSAFIRAVYSPTQFIWKKHASIPAYLIHKASTAIKPEDSEEILNAAIQRKRAGLSSFLQTLPQNEDLTKVELQESQLLTRIGGFLQDNVIPTTPLPQPQPQSSTQPLPAPPPVVPGSSKLNIDVQADVASIPIEKPKEQASSPRPLDVRVAPLATPIIEKTVREAITQTGQTTLYQSAPQPFTNQIELAKRHSDNAVTATTSENLPFPSTPTTPNTVVGMVLDSNSKIVDNAIIEIRDQTGIPVRATKTNKLGQFFSTTPLKNGLYELEVEKEGFNFAIIKLELNGSIVSPLKIQSQA